VQGEEPTSGPARDRGTNARLDSGHARAMRVGRAFVDLHAVARWFLTGFGATSCYEGQRFSSFAERTARSVVPEPQDPIWAATGPHRSSLFALRSSLFAAANDRCVGIGVEPRGFHPDAGIGRVDPARFPPMLRRERGAHRHGQSRMLRCYEDAPGLSSQTVTSSGASLRRMIGNRFG
jgi:hypothetical protein